MSAWCFSISLLFSHHLSLLPCVKQAGRRAGRREPGPEGAWGGGNLGRGEPGGRAAPRLAASVGGRGKDEPLGSYVPCLRISQAVLHPRQAGKPWSLSIRPPAASSLPLRLHVCTPSMSLSHHCSQSLPSSRSSHDHVSVCIHQVIKRK